MTVAGWLMAGALRRWLRDGIQSATIVSKLAKCCQAPPAHPQRALHPAPDSRADGGRAADAGGNEVDNRRPPRATASPFTCGRGEEWTTRGDRRAVPRLARAAPQGRGASGAHGQPHEDVAPRRRRPSRSSDRARDLCASLGHFAARKSSILPAKFHRARRGRHKSCARVARTPARVFSKRFRGGRRRLGFARILPLLAPGCFSSVPLPLPWAISR